MLEGTLVHDCRSSRVEYQEGVVAIPRPLRPKSSLRPPQQKDSTAVPPSPSSASSCINSAPSESAIEPVPVPVSTSPFVSIVVDALDVLEEVDETDVLVALGDAGEPGAGGAM